MSVTASHCCACVQEVSSSSKCIRCKRVRRGHAVAFQCPLCAKHWHTECAEDLRQHVSTDLIRRAHSGLLNDFKSSVPEVRQCGRSWWEALTADNALARSSSATMPRAWLVCMCPPVADGSKLQLTVSQESVLSIMPSSASTGQLVAQQHLSV